MASQQDIRRRIRSVQNTRKITRALELVAGARLRRAQQRSEELRAYADNMMELMSGVARAAPSVRGLALLARREVQTTAIIAFTGDRGLAGPFNAQILRRSFELQREERAQGRQVRWLAVGRKGASSLRFRRYEVTADFAGFSDKPDYADAKAVAHRAAGLYEAGEVDRVLIVYNHFISPLVQRVTVTEVLPIPEDVLGAGREEQSEATAARGDFIYEPEPEEILTRLLPVYLETEIYRALLESAASFLGAQMTAMRNASSNAADLIDRLTLAMNRARQAEITQEILEVVAGADALTS
ncbi:MAG: ATP synthase F1 subunit gamma [Gaiellaceae bacterium]